MDEGRLWELFFATGRPEVYLAIRRAQEEKDWQQLPARQAFQTQRPTTKEI